MTNENLDARISRTLSVVADGVPVHDRLAEVLAEGEPSQGRLATIGLPALAGLSTFIVGLFIVGGVLLALRGSTSEPTASTAPATSTTAPSPTTEPVRSAAEGPCRNESGGIVGDLAITVRSGSQLVDGNPATASIGGCSANSGGDDLRAIDEGLLEDLPLGQLEIWPGANVSISAPTYPGAEVEAAWLDLNTADPPAVDVVTRVDSTTWVLTAPRTTGDYRLSTTLRWREGEATFATVVMVRPPEPEEGFEPPVPETFDVGPELSAEIRSELPATYLRLGLSDMLVLMTTDGRALGHVEGAPFPPATPRQRTADLTTAFLHWPVPEGCIVDEELSSDQLRILCADVADSGSGPTVEILFGDGQREVVAQLPEPPSDLEGAFRLGQFLTVIPSPSNRGAAVAHMSVECEQDLTVIINDGEVHHIDGGSWWGDDYPPGESTPLGWGPDHRALVWRVNGLCSSSLDAPGIYVYDTQGFGNLLVETPDAVEWVELVTSPPASQTAAIYPPLTQATLEALIASGAPEIGGLDVVTSFAEDILEIADPEVTRVGDGTDVTSWAVSGPGLELRVVTRIIAWNTDGEIAVEAITSATSFVDDEDFVLAARVENAGSSWSATFGVPVVGDEATVVFASGDWSVDATARGDSGEEDRVITLELPFEPRETPRLSVIFREDGKIIGFHGLLLPTGEFAAG